MPDQPVILALDQGTTNTKAVLVDGRGDIIAQASRAVGIEYPRPGWVQQDAGEIWRGVAECIEECLDAAGSPVPAVIGISNQRESGLAWERASGAPIGPVVSWQCRRSAELCGSLRSAGMEPEVRRRTGLPIDPMFTAGKLRWLLDAADDGQRRAADGEICVGTVDTWLLWNLTGGEVHATDVSNASRTQLLDLESGTWDPWLLDAFGIPSPALPTVRASSAIFGHTVALGGLPAGVAVGALIGDSHAALFGHAAFEAGSVKATYGTGSSLMMPTPARPAADDGLASTVAWGLDGIVYALEGNIYVTGAAVGWLADLVGLSSASEVAELAAGAQSAEGLYLVPAFVGLGAPHWDDEARGLITGLTRGSTLGQVARATVESIAYQVRDVFDAMRAAVGGDLTVLLADGGAARNDQLMQFQADILAVPVQRNATPELSALGAAYLAGLAAAIWSSPEEIAALPRSVTRFEPGMAPEERERRFRGWQAAVARARYRPA